MQVTVTVSDEIAREAVDCGQNIVEYVELLIDEGQRAKGRPALQSAIDHIRALRSAGEDKTLKARDQPRFLTVELDSAKGPLID